jgi:peptidoglycan/xylan/chitin deacetylase (PgdA/CDA1 family)/folate-dependent phosphoribosylglycinamide formyltransferase PurN
VRIVIFTADPAIDTSPWWPVVLATPGLEAVLVYRQRPRARSGAARRFLANVRKHGLLWIPYRLGYAAFATARAMVRSPAAPHAVANASVQVQVLETDRLAQPDTLTRVADWQPDLGVSLGAPILKPAVFSLPPRGTINLHQGKVPDFRGAPPGFWELATGAKEVGATVHWVDEGLDTGRVIAAAAAPVYPHDSLRTVQARAEELGRIVLARALQQLASGPAAGTPQPSGGSTFRMPLLKQRMALAARLAWRRLRHRAAPRSAAKAAVSVLLLLVARPLRDAVRSVRRRHPLRVFNFHRVSCLCRDGMTVAPDVFERQLDYIRRHHDVVTLDEALAMVRSGRRLRRPAALITFDDGYATVFDRAWPAMDSRGIPGCCFVSTELVGTSATLPHDAASPVGTLHGIMTWENLRTLHAAGWAIGAHSATHARLASVSGDALRREVDGALDMLRRQLGDRMVVVAYPFGGREDISVEARERIRAAGYAACFNDIFGEIPLPADAFDLNRIDLGGDHETLAWKRYAHGISLEPWRWA